MRARLILAALAMLVAVQGCHHRKGGGYLAPAAHATTR